MNETVLRTNGLCKRFSGKVALDHVNMEIRRGEIYGFIGKNGAGKTTLMRIVSGLSAPDGGSFELLGAQTPGDLQKARRRIGMIIETPAIYGDMSAHDNLEVQRRVTGAAGKHLLEETLALVGLEDTGRKKVKAFSLGMKQRLGLAVALLGKPDFLLLDEPINGLDPIGIAALRETLRRLVTDQQMTILISSHILPELHQLATHYGMIDNGRMVEQISAAGLEEKCRQFLRLVVSDAEKAAVVLEEKLGVKDMRVIPGNEIQLYAFLDEPERVTAALTADGIGVKSIGVTGIDLESYFIQLTGGLSA